MLFPLVPKAIRRETGTIELSDLKELYQTDSSKTLFKEHMEESVKSSFESWEKKHDQTIPEEIKEQALEMMEEDCFWQGLTYAMEEKAKRFSW